MDKEKKVVRGMPTAVLVSILIHAGLFLLAGMFVVFTVVKQKEVEFAPPKAVERPKMKLKKPKVRVKKSSKPKSTTRIVTKVQKASMPDIQLPEMSGIGEGLAGGEVGFDLMPDLDVVTIFGSGQSIGNDFEGVVYDFKRRRNGGNFSVAMSADDVFKFREYIERFIKSGWKTGSIARFYQSPRKLYAPMIMIPPITSALGPWAFGEREMYPYQYMLHYKGELVHKDGIKFRFVVMGDNFLLIRLDGKVVMDYKNQFEHVLTEKQFKPLNYHLGHWYAYASDWIELEPGVPKKMEVICGDYKGGLFSAMIAVEEYGVDYPRAPLPQDNPVLPIFKTAALSRDQVDAVYEFMWEGHLMVTNGPIFNDYDTASYSLATPPPSELNPSPPPPVEPAMRTWTLDGEKKIEAKYVVVMGGKVVLKTARGKTLKIPLPRFSEEDLGFLELLNPPDLKLVFKRHTGRFKVLYNPNTGMAIPTAQNFAGGVVIKQLNMTEYTHPLRVELYVIADEIDGNNFILLDRQIETFALTPENQKTFEIRGRDTILRKYENYGGVMRGEKYKGYMILVYDERGEIIAKNLSHDWLLDLVDILREFPVGRHFNKKGERVHPPRPKFSDRFWEHAP